MNERILKLAADARGQMTVLTTVDDQLWIEHEDFVEKFAKLVVQECAELAGCNGHVSGFALGDLIKEHFGVNDER